MMRSNEFEGNVVYEEVMSYLTLTITMEPWILPVLICWLTFRIVVTDSLFIASNNAMLRNLFFLAVVAAVCIWKCIFRPFLVFLLLGSFPWLPSGWKLMHSSHPMLLQVLRFAFVTILSRAMLSKILMCLLFYVLFLSLLNTTISKACKLSLAHLNIWSIFSIYTSERMSFYHVTHPRMQLKLFSAFNRCIRTFQMWRLCPSYFFTTHSIICFVFITRSE